MTTPKSKGPGRKPGRVSSLRTSLRAIAQGKKESPNQQNIPQTVKKVCVSCGDEERMSALTEDAKRLEGERDVARQAADAAAAQMNHSLVTDNTKQQAKLEALQAKHNELQDLYALLRYAAAGESPFGRTLLDLNAVLMNQKTDWMPVTDAQRVNVVNVLMDDNAVLRRRIVELSARLLMGTEEGGVDVTTLRTGFYEALEGVRVAAANVMRVANEPNTPTRAQAAWSAVLEDLHRALRRAFDSQGGVR